MVFLLECCIAFGFELCYNTRMTYKNILEATFISRPNRFIAEIEVGGIRHLAHVKNTGRCKELLIPNTPVYVEQNDNPDRKTKFSLISVYKGDRLINMDSQAPNKVFLEHLQADGFADFSGITHIKTESKFGNSRLDIYAEAGGRRAFFEVKGVTLETDGVAKFPDAPTQRGIKHLQELEKAIIAGYEAFIIFVIQMDCISHFTPNHQTHPEFAMALAHAMSNGVNAHALTCKITNNSIKINNFVEVKMPK